MKSFSRAIFPALVCATLLPTVVNAQTREKGPWWPNAQTRRERAMGEIWQITAHSSKLRPPCVANRASRATSGRIWR